MSIYRCIICEQQKQKELFKAQTEMDLIYQMIDDINYMIRKEEAEVENGK